MSPPPTLQVLDRGFVSLVDSMGTDLTVVNAARVSFAKRSDWERTHVDPVTQEEDVSLRILSMADVKLLMYLAKHNHWTPFAHPQICLHIKAPIAIRTQFFKHKVGFVENEVSRRYVKDTPEFYIPKWRTAPTDGAKQGSSGPIQDHHEVTMLDLDYMEQCGAAIEHYNSLIQKNIAPEQARMVLPQGMYTEWFWTGSLSAYARFYRQRSDPHAQWEIRQYAEAIHTIIQDLFPYSWNVLTENPSNLE